MALSDLLASLDARAAIELDELTAAQRSEAAALRTAAQREADSVVERAVSEARDSARAEASRLHERVVAESRQRLNEALHAELQRLADALQERLRAVPGTPEGDKATVTLLSEALSVLPHADRVWVQAAHREAAARAVADSPASPELSADLPSLGAVVAEGTGRRVVNTVEVRLAAMWPQFRVQAAADWRGSR